MKPTVSLRKRASSDAAKLRGVGAVDAHRAAGRLIEAADQVQERGFAGAGGPHDGDPLAAFGGEADAIDRMHGRERRCRRSFVTSTSSMNELTRPSE